MRNTIVRTQQNSVNEKDSVVHMPLFSVVVPVYNTPPVYLKECINSLIHQTYNTLQIVLINDGSSEECTGLCRKIASEDSRILLFEQEHSGVSAARNRGMRLADGEWILFVDSDDYLEKNTLETICPYISEYKFDILLFNLVQEYPDASPEIMDHGFLSGSHCADNADTKEFLCRKVVNPISEPGKKANHSYCMRLIDKVYRKDWLNENGLTFDETLRVGEDSLFMLHCMEKVRNLYCIDKVFYHYRRNPYSVTMNLPPDIAEQRKIYAAKTFPVIKRISNCLAEMRNGQDDGILYRDYCAFLFLLLKLVIIRTCENGKCTDAQCRKTASTFARSPEMRPALTIFSEDPKEMKIQKFLLKHGLVSCFMARWEKLSK